MLHPIVTFLLFTGVVAVIAFLKTRHDDHKTASGFFLASRSLTWVVICGSLLLTNLSTEQLVGLNGGAFRDGMVLMCWEVGAALAMVAMMLLFLPRYLKGGVTTVPQFLEDRFDKGTRAMVSGILLAIMTLNIMPFVLYSGGLFMRDVFGMTAFLENAAWAAGLVDLAGGAERAALWLMVIAIGVVGSVYALVGGLKAVAVSDTVNGVGLLIGGLMIPVLGLMAIGGDSVWGGLKLLLEEHPEKFDSVGGPNSGVPFSTLFTGLMLINIFYWCTNQAIVQRTFGARSLEQGQKGVFAAAMIKLIGPFYLILPGIIAFHMFKGDPTVGDRAYAKLVEAVLPQWATGFFAAVIFGAILSSFNSALNSATTLFSVDIYKGYINKRASDPQSVRVARIFGIVLAVVAIIVAPLANLFPQGLFELMKQLNALFSIPLLTVVLLGLLTKRTPAYAAKIAIVFGLVFYATFGLQLIPDLKGTIRSEEPVELRVAMLKVEDSGEGEFQEPTMLPILPEDRIYIDGDLVEADIRENFATVTVPAGAHTWRVKAVKDPNRANEFNYSLTTDDTDYIPGTYFVVQGPPVEGVEIATNEPIHWLHFAAINFVLMVGIMLGLGAIKPRKEPYVQQYTREVDITPWKFAVPGGILVVVLVVLLYIFFHAISG